MNWGIPDCFDGHIDVLLGRRLLLMDMPMNVEVYLTEGRLMDRNMSKNHVELFKEPPHIDFLEVLLKGIPLTIDRIVVADDESFLAVEPGQDVFSTLLAPEVDIPKMINLVLGGD
jgi:hypothetical protein